jgi:hypothetical protein
MLGGVGRAGDFNGVRVLELRIALEPVDLVLLEEELDAAGQLLHGGRLLAHQDGQVDLDASGLHAELGGGAMRHLLEHFRAVQQGLGGMQPTLRQVPPSVARPSAQAVFRPSCAARMAAT